MPRSTAKQPQFKSGQKVRLTKTGARGVVREWNGTKYLVHVERHAWVWIEPQYLQAI